MHERLQKIFRMVFNDAELLLKDDLAAQDIEDWDSLRHISLMIAIEKEFNIKFSLREINKLANVSELKQLLSEKLSEKL